MNKPGLPLVSKFFSFFFFLLFDFIAQTEYIHLRLFFSATGSAAEAMEDYERAIAAYESSLRHNPYSVPAMNAIAGVHRTMDRFEKVKLSMKQRTHLFL